MRKAKYLSLLSIVVVIIVFFAVKTGNKNAPVAETDWGEPLGGLTNDLYLQRISETPSDIEGLSVRDKMALGLSEFDGSDTDGDGLTDKEEIEVYGTDPLLASTSGDFLSDKYKVENNLDINQQYDVADFSDVALEYVRMNAPVGVTAEASSLADYYMGEIIDVSGTFDDSINADNEWNIYSTYLVKRFSGRFGVRLNDIGCDAKEKNVVLLMQNGQTAPYEPVESSIEDGVIYLDIDEYPTAFIVAVAEEKSFFEKLQARFGLIKNTFGSATNDGTSDLEVKSYTPAVALYSRFLDIWAWRPGVVYYTSCGDKDEDAKNLEIFCAGQNALRAGGPNGGGHTPILTIDDCKEVPSERLFSLISLCNAMLGDHNNCPILMAGDTPKVIPDPYRDSDYFISYFTTLNISNPATSTWTVRQAIEESVSNVMEEQITTHEYTLNDNFLPFQNFGSYIFSGGNCAGIAYYTAALYNGEDVLSRGNIKFTRNDGSTVEYVYDVTKYSENATLLDPILSDFRDSNFVNDHRDANGYIDYNNLSSADKQFIDMIGTYGAYMNSIPDVNVAGNGVAGSIAVTYQTLINAMKELDNGRMLILGTVLFSDKYVTNEFGQFDINRAIAEGAPSFAHAVNLVGYEIDDSGKFCKTTFYVYDSNHPDRLGNFVFYSVNRDPKSIVDWYYNPPSAYSATSWAYDEDHYNRLVIFDSRLNDLTSMVQVASN